MPRRSSRGFTIIEVLVVVAIMAGFFSLVANVFRSSFPSESRRFGRELQGVIKYYYNQAILTGKTYRVVIPFPKEAGEKIALSVEMAQAPFVRAATPADGTEDEEADATETPPDESAAGGAESGEEGEASAPPLPTFVSPTKAEFAPVTGLGATTKVPKRIVLRRVCVPGEEKPREEGTAYVYLYPNGTMDAATMVFSNSESSQWMVMVTNPVTGMTTLRRELPKEGPCAE